MIKFQNSIIGILLAALALVLMSSCSSDGPKEGNEVPDIPTISALSLSESQKESLKQANDFSFNLYSAMAKNYEECFNNLDGNFSVSPLSTNIALGMASNFMDGNLKSTTLSALGYDNGDDLNETSRQVIAYLNNRENTGMELSLANSLWWTVLYQDFLNKKVVDRISEYYFAPNFGVDFYSYLAYKRMNEWVAENTNNMIPKMFEESNQMAEGIVQVCINALYAEADWLEKFPTDGTHEANFFGEQGEIFVVDMMSNWYQGDYADCENFEAFTIPFRGSMTMTVLLPKEGVSAIELSKGFNKEIWANTLSAMSPAAITLNIPKFTIETSAEMNPALESMGIDLNGQARNLLYTNGHTLYMKVIQKTSLAINEEGAKLAAATAVEATEGGPGSKLPRVRVRVDRPFLYFITEQATGSVLLAGRVCTPVKK